MTYHLVYNHPILSSFMTYHLVYNHPILSSFMTYHLVYSHPILSSFMTYHLVYSHPILSSFMTYHRVYNHPILSSFMTYHLVYNHPILSSFMTYHRVYSHPILSSFITGLIIRVTRRVPHVEQELLTHPEHLISPPVFSGVRVIRSLVLCICFVDHCLSFFFWPLCSLSFFDLHILISPLVFSNSSKPSFVNADEFFSLPN
jgi:hypothetical protein